MSPTRVAWILYGSIEQRTGGTIYDRLIVERLEARNVRVDIVSLDRSRPDPFALVRRLARASYDILVGDELCFRELAVAFSRLRGPRRVLLVHHRTCWESELPPASRQRARFWESIAARHADRIIATSHATRARLLREGAARRIDVVLPGADRLPIVPPSYAEDDQATRFLFLGAVIPRKRVRELIDAFTSSTTNAELRIAGSRSADARYCRSLAFDRVVFLDEIDDRRIAFELANADALVMPSSLEGYGIAATEAIRAGVPVIAARAAGLSEALANAGKAALFVDSNADLERALGNFASNVELRRRMRVAANEARARMPTWDDAGTAFFDALHDA